MFNEYLCSAMANNVPVSIYTDKNDTDKFSFGFIQGVSNDYILIAAITPFGFYDGYTIKSYIDIYRIESQDKYGKKVHKLYLLHEQKHQLVDNLTDNLILDLIRFANEKHLAVSIELFHSESDDLQGFVADIQGDMVTIEQLDDDGKKDGNSVISLEDITDVVCDSDLQMALKLLSSN